MRQHSYMSGLSSACTLYVASSVRHTDVAFERCVKKGCHLFRLKNELGRFSFGSVFFIRIKKMNSPTGRKNS